ncbi:MAG TPA: phytanoyl-CoA dioxygenase family protein [Gemmataceae bacterium]|nr:phytanoyl-CoA dioxygenase family protein [Gemmataceae bacterium]
MLSKLNNEGYAIALAVFTADQVVAMLTGLEHAFRNRDDVARRSEGGSVFAARNVLELWPPAALVWRQGPLPDLLCRCLGPDFGLVRGLYFDKPPDRSWALPWHKDLTIAVRQHRPSQRFSHPTIKAGVAHVEAPREILEKMLTLRIHLDEVIVENGPLQVIPGSHRHGTQTEFGDKQPVPVFANKGDVLLIRPLVAHCSGGAAPGTQRHRRILHLEFAAAPTLPDGFEWHEFFAGSPTPKPV